MGCCASKTTGSKDQPDTTATAVASNQYNQQQPDAGFVANNGGTAVLGGPNLSIGQAAGVPYGAPQPGMTGMDDHRYTLALRVVRE